jgi:flagellar biosynthesis GTPase FlhF
MNEKRLQTGSRIYRGRTLEDLLPRIREELGPDAVVVGQRETLGGGVAGFFQRPIVEVAARPGRPSLIDVYDDRTEPRPSDRAYAAVSHPAAPHAPEPPATTDPAMEEGLRTRAIQRLVAEAAPFAEQLSVAQARARGTDGATPSQFLADDLEVDVEELRPGSFSPDAVPADAGRRPPAADVLEARLVESGIPPELAADVVAETVSHTLPFGTARQLRRLVRAALARRIPVQPSFHGRRRRIAVVGAGGSGKTLCVARLASAYAAGSDLPVCAVALCAEGASPELAMLVEPLGVRAHIARDAKEARRRLAALDECGLAVLDTPSVSPGDPEAIAELADRLRLLDLDEVHLALPVTLGQAAAEDLLDGLRPLGVSRLLLTHTDETPHVGPAIGLAVERGLPFSYVSRGSELPGGLLPADASDLATRALP